MKITNETKLIGVAVLAGAGLIWWISRKVSAGSAQSVGSTIAENAVKAVGNGAVGLFTGALHTVGVPYVDSAQCKRDVAAGDWFAAMSSCPIDEYADAVSNRVFGSTALSAEAAAESRRTFAATDPRRLDLQQPDYDPMIAEYGMDYRYF